MKMKKMDVMKIIGIVLLVVGAAVLVFGAYDLISYNTSTEGKITKAFGMRSRAETVRNSVIFMLAGAAAAGVGFFLFIRRK